NAGIMQIFVGSNANVKQTISSLVNNVCMIREDVLAVGKMEVMVLVDSPRVQQTQVRSSVNVIPIGMVLLAQRIVQWMQRDGSVVVEEAVRMGHVRVLMDSRVRNVN
ncbi:hypothetical protein ADUPG1_004032, partial [Aduncisulcus paluster]